MARAPSPHRPIATLLVANRGEIARRVLRAGRELGMRTVAVHGSADADAAFVREADVAVHIGDESGGLPYLDGAAIVAAALRTGADAVHPGYGFLAERADFAEAVLAAGLVWVGPSPAVMRAMADKDAAKAQARRLGVPVVPGVEGRTAEGERLTLEALAELARAEVGFPCLVKAAAGGGGRGMRRVDAADALLPALQAATLEAERNFGDGTLLVERYIGRGRHIEVQIVADLHGQTVHLLERECSVQRRHQKLIEEAPAPALPDAVRAAIAADAVRLAAGIGYAGAGTVEFLVDADTHAHHFLEVNARVQVEHPVTELVTGVDIVQTQLRVAAGEPLGLQQEAIVPRGHAVEVRLCAEDARAGFAPQAGPVERFAVPQGPVLRLDAAFDPAHDGGRGEVPVYYDSMVAKLVAHGPNRAVALARLRRALAETRLFGVTHNRSWLLAALDHADVREARVTTRWVDDGDGAALALPTPGLPGLSDVALAAAALARHADALGRRFRSNPSRPDITVFTDDAGAAVHVALQALGADRFAFHVERSPDPMLHVPPRAERTLQLVGRDADGVQVRFEGATWRIWLHGAETPDAPIWVQDAGVDGSVGEPVRLHEGTLLTEPEPEKLAAGAVVAPSSAIVVQVHVAVGDRVAAGDRLVTVEAMKMLTPLVAAADGEVAAIFVAPGESVAAGAALCEVRPDEQGAE
ncbi:MAG: hypothetical protein RIT45_1702 [Pseudomonadota bacterium]